MPRRGGQPQGGESSRSSDYPQEPSQPAATELPRRSGQPQDSGLPRRGAHSRDTGGPGLWASEQSATDSSAAADERSWFTAHKPSAPPREREPGFDRDYRVDRDHAGTREQGPGDLPRERAAQPTAAQDFEPTRPEQGAFRAEAPTARPQRLDPPDRQEQPGYSEHTSYDPTPTRFDQPRVKDQGRIQDQPRIPDGRAPQASQEISPVYQTGMQLVVPPGQEWTFRDPGTGAFQGYQPGTSQPGTSRPGTGPSGMTQSGMTQPGTSRPGTGPSGMTQSGMTQPGISRPGMGQPDGRQPGPFGSGGRTGYEDRAGYQGRASFGDQAVFGDQAPFGDRAGFADQGRASFSDQGGYSGFGPAAPYAPGEPGARPLAQPAQRTRGRKVPILIGAGAVVAVVAIGAVVAAPRLLKHADPGCSTYTSSALPAYNHAITDLNAQASQATLTADLTTAITQLSTAMGQAKGVTVKTALQGLLTDLNTVQADVRKGSVPAATVSSLNSASATADNACS